MKELSVAVVGCGFWSQFQTAGWRELPGVRVVGVCDQDRAKADRLASPNGAGAFDDVEKMLDACTPDVLDVITNVETHERFVELAAARKIAVICQKPMAPTLAAATSMVQTCRRAGVPFFIHENWRWQAPIRQLKSVLDSGVIGEVFRARISMVSGFPVFKNQPFLAELEQFVLTDVGSHVLDAARYYFGEASSVYCHTNRVHPHIKGEDVATVMMRMGNASVTCHMGYASNHLEHDRFPETYIFVEGTRGSVELAPDFWIRTTTENGTHAKRYPSPRFAWADPAYDVVHASIVACNANLAAALRGEALAETTGEDNLRTVRLIFAAYESASTGKAVPL